MLLNPTKEFVYWIEFSFSSILFNEPYIQFDYK